MNENISIRLEKIISFLRKNDRTEFSKDTLEYSASIINECLSILGMSRPFFAKYLNLTHHRLVRYWCSAKYMPRVGTFLVLQGLINQTVERPDQVDNCTSALQPHLENLIKTAENSGWEIAEINSALLQILKSRSNK